MKTPIILLAVLGLISAFTIDNHINDVDPTECSK